MKKLLHILMLTVVFVTLSASAAKAQTNSARQVIAKIPFAFTVGKTNLPAGKYAIRMLNASSDRKVLQIRSVDGPLSAMLLTNCVTSTPADNAKLVFERYDDIYVFAQVQMAGESTSFEALHSKAKRKQMIAATGNRRVVVITIG